jgi:hypothetical protein
LEKPRSPECENENFVPDNNAVSKFQSVERAHLHALSAPVSAATVIGLNRPLQDPLVEFAFTGKLRLEIAVKNFTSDFPG